MSGTRPGALCREALKAPTFSLRGTLLRFAIISLGVGIWSAAVSTPEKILLARRPSGRRRRDRASHGDGHVAMNRLMKNQGVDP